MMLDINDESLTKSSQLYSGIENLIRNSNVKNNKDIIDHIILKNIQMTENEIINEINKSGEYLSNLQKETIFYIFSNNFPDNGFDTSMRCYYDYCYYCYL